MNSEQEALLYLPPVARTTIALFTEHSFHYDSVSYKGWAIQSCIEFEEDRCFDDGYVLDSSVSVIWLETQDCWCADLDDEFTTDEDAIAYVTQLIDKAEVSHGASPGQLSLFAEE